MPAITKNLLGTEQTILTATHELIIVSGTLTNTTQGDVLASVVVTRANERYSVVDDLMLSGSNYPPVVRRPENVCTKMILGVGDSIAASARPSVNQDYWQSSTTSGVIDQNYQAIIYDSMDNTATINFGYFPMED